MSSQPVTNLGDATLFKADEKNQIGKQASPTRQLQKVTVQSSNWQSGVVSIWNTGLWCGGDSATDLKHLSGYTTQQETLSASLCGSITKLCMADERSWLMYLTNWLALLSTFLEFHLLSTTQLLIYTWEQDVLTRSSLSTAWYCSTSENPVSISAQLCTFTALYMFKLIKSWM